MQEGAPTGTVIAGRYEVKAEIGRGGMGVVYEVEHLNTGERLALKVLTGAASLHAQTVARFKREARASSQIKSEHVVRVIDADAAPELDGAPFLVMELLNGTDLEQHVTKNGPMPPAMLLTVLGQIGEALHAAHQLGIVHRDVKPENLFLQRRGDGVVVAKVLDFGISKFSADAGVGLTTTGAFLGTPLYMAPEQANGDNEKITPATDIWALGLVTLRLLTGEHLWGSPSMAELITKIVVAPVWIKANASPTFPTLEESRRALAERDEDGGISLGGGPNPSFELSVVTTYGALLLGAERLAEAEIQLTNAARACVLVPDVRAIYLLGNVYAKKGDNGRACAAYAQVEQLWGHAKPRSITAEAARAEAKRLDCHAAP